MNKKVEDYLKSKAENKQSRINEFLLKEGLYDVVFAPSKIKGKGFIKDTDKFLEFPVESDAVDIGDEVDVNYKGETVRVIVDELTFCQDKVSLEEYPRVDYFPQYKCVRNYKIVPIELNAEEREALSEFYNFDNVVKEDKIENKNSIASILTVIAVITYIAGLISGFVIIEEFGFLSVVCWIVSFVYGSFILGFSEIIKLLTAIRNK